MINSLHITNFRGFEDLKLEGLGRVNLVTGSNNAGKTSLLEALCISACSIELDPLLKLLRRPDAPELLVQGQLYNSVIRQGSELSTIRVRTDTTNWFINCKRNKPISVQPGSGPKLSIRIMPVSRKPIKELISNFSIAVRNPSDEKLLESLLNQVDSRVKSIRLDYADNRANIVVDVGLKEKIPVSQLGEGINRLVAIFSELLGDKVDMCIIDEIENGIYYLALKDVWMGLAGIAELNNIQIFATTHSRECLEAAHEVYASRSSYDLRVIQLYPLENDQNGGRVLDREHIEVGADSNIDLR